MSAITRLSSSSPELPKTRIPHKRVRSIGATGKSTFYGEERPVIINGKVLISGGLTLPLLSSSYLVSKNGEIKRLKTGQSFEENEEDQLLCKQTYSSSKRFNINVSQTIGRRIYMEDMVMIKGELFDGIDYIGVFDGHNGKDAAKKAMETFHKLLDEYLIKSDHYLEHLNHICNEIQQLISFTTASGTTASVIIIREDDVIFCYIGDSPIYIKSNEQVKKISIDHNTSNEEEVKRIINCGGSVVDINGTKRVNSKIVLTRSLGDKSLHPPLTNEPTIISIPLNEIDSIIVASDGISSISCELLNELTNPTFGLEQQAVNIRNIAYEKNSPDNISVVVIQITQPIISS
ncbi:protein phosphatase domain containing protein [Entamoeba histolytica HM-1:IMSS-B]|uniref:Protein phosphatase domain-containing protein n=6 Tax=Entamoeba histolytica TaxID=5759 RepID=C4M0D7_ENTH1|nr:protein phosphatase domain-containing protein [Entamoeba histolytica HM-1:IMSS]EMD42744.1 protein phosphatase domain containing protein [Entamoeba histolytica KU27]EMH76898.1 protein phosphatase domain containing protein [Entamoeba histolytica HM-1:IMSS-B]EMS12533.1 protein phosphatase domain containing protein [Entamoeba histolytica HM-3:IMSS]ENY65876.1 protein phosphatase domain containing protein [Entamoeba histolytica HM-1:IMSS-A]GAT94621.1 protein phosphatase domain-containing protein |eukprot:XP_654009.2 protein phosphatase domain-containing protein [Entamoeba histolytica HM-1:IMSS]